MGARVVIPELLDGLPPLDPEARRSRRDLRLINFLMGNERWLLRSLAGLRAMLADGCEEWGAGEGHLTRRIVERFPEARVTARDLMPPPAGLPGRVRWVQGDLLQAADGPGGDPGGVLIANLFLHHFAEGKLAALAERSRRFSALLIVEPLRARLPHALGWLLHPLVNRVTRHDLHASLRAGFQPGELPGVLGLEGGEWKWMESVSARGAVRLAASRS
jgi:hypothetical protein